jgi:hypothetical protein
MAELPGKQPTEGLNMVANNPLLFLLLAAAMLLASCQVPLR